MMQERHSVVVGSGRLVARDDCQVSSQRLVVSSLAAAYMLLFMLGIGSKLEATELNAIAILEKQESHRRDALPLKFVATVVTHKGNGERKESVYHCQLDGPRTRVDRIIKPPSRATELRDAAGEAPGDGYYIKEQFLRTPDFLAYRGLTPEVEREIVTVNAATSSLQATFRVPAVERYGMQRFPLPFLANEWIEKADPLKKETSVKHEISEQDDGRVIVSYTTPLADVTRIYDVNKGFQLVSYEVVSMGSGRVMKSTFDHQFVDSKFWFPKRSTYVSSVGETIDVRVDTRVTEIEAGQRFSDEVFTLKSFDLAAGNPVDLVSDSGLESLAWDGDRLVPFSPRLLSEARMAVLDDQSASPNWPVFPFLMIVAGATLIVWMLAKPRSWRSNDC